MEKGNKLSIDSDVWSIIFKDWNFHISTRSESRRTALLGENLDASMEVNAVSSRGFFELFMSRNPWMQEGRGTAVAYEKLTLYFLIIA
jgi:hypothetical protein